MKSSMLRLNAVLLSFCLLSSCGRVNSHDKLQPVHDASLKIRARISIGVTRLDFPNPLYELAYEILKAEEQTLSSSERTALNEYSKALKVYQASLKVWEAQQEYESCLTRYGVRSDCIPRNVAEIAEAAEISTEAVTVSGGVQTAWAVAEQKLRKAEELRLRR